MNEIHASNVVSPFEKLRDVETVSFDIFSVVLLNFVFWINVLITLGVYFFSNIVREAISKSVQ